MHYYAHLDRSASEATGPDATFQVISIEDDDDNNYTESIGLDQSVYFHSLEEFENEIERLIGEPAESDEA